MNYLKQIYDIYDEFGLETTDEQVLDVYNHFAGDKYANNKIKTFILKQSVANLLSNKKINDPIKFLRDKKIMTCLSSDRFGTNGNDFGGALKNGTYLSVNKKWIKDLDKNNILIVYSIPDKQYFVMTSQKIKTVNKIGYQYSYFIDIREFINIFDVYDIYKTIYNVVN